VSRRAGQKEAKRQANRIIQEQLAAERRRRRRIWITVIAVLVLVVAGAVGWSVFRSQTPETFASPAGVTDDGGTKAGITVAGDGPVTVEIYLDFLCPHCRDFEAATANTLDQLAAQNKIRLVWHPLGFLDSATSPAGYSTRAANAAGCAADAGKLEAYGSTLFANQPAEGSAGLTDDQLIELGGPVGLNAPSFAQCVRGGNYGDWVSNVDAMAARRGVNSTPAVFVDGTLLEQPTVQALIAAIDAAS
jgi:protein-disulfide isomerase